MKYQALFSLKNNEKYSRLSSATVVIGALRVWTTWKQGRYRPASLSSDFSHSGCTFLRFTYKPLGVVTGKVLMWPKAYESRPKSLMVTFFFQVLPLSKVHINLQMRIP